MEAGIQAYNVQRDSWLQERGLPCLNQARRSSSSCVLGDTVLYTFGGLKSMSKNEDSVSSIERIRVDAITNRAVCRDEWHLINLGTAESGLDFNRINPIISPINDSQIMFLGGFEQGIQCKDCLIYDANKQALS